MKDGKKLLYSSPEAEIISVSQDDVIQTSAWLKTVEKLLGGTKWKQEWSDILEPQGMEELN